MVFEWPDVVGLTPERLDRALGMLQQRGALAVFLGLNVPGARAGIIPAAGLVGMPYPAFTPAMVGGSSVFYGWHIALGYLVGPSAVMLLERLNLPVGPVLAGLAGVGLVGWLILRTRARRAAAPSPEDATLDRLHSWTDAACPACLAMAAMRQVREHRLPGTGGLAG